MLPFTAFEMTFSAHHGIASYPAGASLGARRLDDHELVWIQSGDVVWHTEEGDRCLPTGSVVLAKPGRVDAFTWDAHRTTRHAYVHFSLPEPISQPCPPMAATAAAAPVVHGLLSQVVHLLADEEPTAVALATTSMAALLATLLGRDLIERRTPALPPPLRRLLEHVQQRWSGDRWPPLDMAELAGAAGVSEAHLSRLVSRYLGASPMHLLRLVRLRRAADLLQRTDLEIGTIAEAVGFASPFHFSRAFTSVYGAPPSVYRAAPQRPTGPPLPPMLLRLLLG